MLKTLAVAVLACAVAAACGKSDKQKREGSAAAVEVVTGDARGGSASGPAADEVEPNDSDETATPLPLAQPMRGRIDHDDDTDHYRLDITTAGVLTASVSAIDGFDLVLEIEDSTGTVIAKSDRGGGRISEGVPNLAVSPGRYTAIVRGKKAAKPKTPVKGKGKDKDKDDKKAEPDEPAGASPVYEISASVGQLGKGVEREPDDDRGTANDLLVGDTASGYLGWAGDVDAWKLSVETLSAKDAVDIEVTAVEGVALTLELADGLGGTLATRKGGRGQPLVVRGVVPVVPAGAPPFHYLTLKGDRSNFETAYQLKVTAHVIPPDAEIEPNDSVDKPMPMPADRTIVHATWSPGDVDCFALAPGDGRTVEATVDTQGDIDLSAELLVDGKSVAKADQGKKGAAEKVSGHVPAGSKAVIRVKGEGTAEGGYNLVVQETATP